MLAALAVYDLFAVFAVECNLACFGFAGFFVKTLTLLIGRYVDVKRNARLRV